MQSGQQGQSVLGESEGQDLTRALVSHQPRAGKLKMRKLGPDPDPEHQAAPVGEALGDTPAGSGGLRSGRKPALPRQARREDEDQGAPLVRSTLWVRTRHHVRTITAPR